MTRRQCPVCHHSTILPIGEHELPTPDELEAAIVLICERNAERALPIDERRALETIRALLMEDER